MRILIFLFLSMSCLIYYGNAAGKLNRVELASADDTVLGEATVRQKREAGGETEQDPNDPKYQNMAKELVLNNLRIKEEDTKNIKVNRITTQVVAGIITRIEIKITLVSGNSDTCNFEVWEKSWENVKHVTFKCLNQKTVLSDMSGKPRNEQTRDPKDPKYQRLAKTSIDSWFQTAGHKPFEKEDISKITVTEVKVQVGPKIMSYLKFNVITVNNKNYQCTSTIGEKPWNPQETAKVSVVTCEIAKTNSKLSLSASPSKLNLPGGEVDEDPNDPKYQSLAKLSFQRYLDSHGNVNVQVKSIKIYSVTSQVVAGTNIRMHFRVYPTRGNRFECQANIFETLSGHYSDFNVSCNINMGGEEDQDPDDPQYQQLAKESFQFYLKSHKENVHVKRIKVDSVTTQVVAGMITRIQFDVYPTRGSRFDCRSKIYEKLGPGRNLEFDVKCDRIVGGDEERDPNEPQFQQLAKESFRKYQETHIGPLFAIKEQRVTRATTQVVAGLITRLDFYVTTTEGGKYTCNSEIYEQPWKKIKKIDVNCHFVGTGGGSAKLAIKRNSNSKSYNFATEAVKRYLEDEYEKLSLKVARSETRGMKTLTTRASKQKITYYKVDAFAYVPNGDHSMFNCSVLAGSWFGKKPIATNCIKVNYLTGRSVWVDPTNKNYLSFAGKSLQLYLKNFREIEGPRDYTKYDIIVTFVERGLAAGYVNYMNYVARWVHGNDDDPTVFICGSTVWEKLDGKNDIQDVWCDGVSWDRRI